MLCGVHSPVCVSAFLSSSVHHDVFCVSVCVFHVRVEASGVSEGQLVAGAVKSATNDSLLVELTSHPGTFFEEVYPLLFYSHFCFYACA